MTTREAVLAEPADDDVLDPSLADEISGALATPGRADVLDLVKGDVEQARELTRSLPQANGDQDTW